MEFEHHRLPHEREEHIREPNHVDLFDKLEEIHELLRKIDQRI